METELDGCFTIYTILISGEKCLSILSYSMGPYRNRADGCITISIIILYEIKIILSILSYSMRPYGNSARWMHYYLYYFNLWVSILSHSMRPYGNRARWLHYYLYYFNLWGKKSIYSIILYATIGKQS